MHVREFTPQSQNERLADNAEVRIDFPQTSKHLKSYERGREVAEARRLVEESQAREYVPSDVEVLARQGLILMKTRAFRAAQDNPEMPPRLSQNDVELVG